MSWGLLLMRGDSPHGAPVGTTLAAQIGVSTTHLESKMRARHLAVSITAAAVMGAFGVAWAQSSSTVQQSQTTQNSPTAPSGAGGLSENATGPAAAGGTTASGSSSDAQNCACPPSASSSGVPGSAQSSSKDGSAAINS